MDYAAITFWLTVIVFSALGVHRLWCALLQPKIVNTILLPGTLVATLGHVLGLLITGGTVENTALITDNDSGEPQTGTNVKPKVPIVGAIVVALFPMLGCALAVYGVAAYLGSPIMEAVTVGSKDRLILPIGVALFFDMLREVIGLAQRFIEAIRTSDLTDWRTLLFLYLSVCLTVRMAPLAGNLRGVLGAIVLTGLAAYLLGSLLSPTPERMASIWMLIRFAVSVLSFLLIVTLLITAAVRLVKTLLDQKG